MARCRSDEEIEVAILIKLLNAKESPSLCRLVTCVGVSIRTLKRHLEGLERIGDIKIIKETRPSRLSGRGRRILSASPQMVTRVRFLLTSQGRRKALLQITNKASSRNQVP